MLNEEELERLRDIELATQKHSLARMHEKMTTPNWHWLIEKVKELNDECSKVTEELYKSNQLSAALSERLE